MSEMLGKKINLGERAQGAQKEKEWLPARGARWGLESRDEE